MDDLSEIAQGGLKTTGTLLQGVSNNLGNPGVGIAASALNASSEFLGHGVKLWQAWKDNFDGYIGKKRFIIQDFFKPPHATAEEASSQQRRPLDQNQRRLPIQKSQFASR